jgi:hypothetical protein
MNPNPFSLGTNQKTAKAQNSVVGEALIEILTAFAHHGRRWRGGPTPFMKIKVHGLDLT